MKEQSPQSSQTEGKEVSAMTVEQLLQPRYKVIADYPDTIYFANEILAVVCDDEDGQHCESLTVSGRNKIWNLYPNLYPHIFKPLQWWEERDAKDMPEYVKDKSAIPATISKVTYQKGVETENGLQPDRMISDKNNWAIVKNVMCFFEPATLKEYNQYNNQ